MNQTPAKWDDLRPRLLSAAAMGVIGLAAILLGDIWFSGLVAIAAGVMVWELARMLGPNAPKRPPFSGPSDLPR